MNVRRVLVSVGVLALVIVVAANLGRLSQLPQLFSHVNILILLLIIPVQLVGYWLNAKFYQSFLKILGYKVELKRLYETALAVNFVNQAFPSGGISGISYLTRDLSDQVPSGKLTLTQLGRQVFTYLSFLAVLGFGFLFLFYGGNINRVTVRVILLFIILLLGVGIFIATVISYRPLVERLSQPLLRVINRLGRLFRKHALVGAEQVKHFLDEFYHGRSILLESRGQWHGPALFALGGNVTELLTIYVVFVAFGRVLNPGVVIAAYALANIVSISGVATSGAGVYEATMIASLVALGQPFSLSFSVVILYRIVNMAIFLPVGFHYYRQRI